MENQDDIVSALELLRKFNENPDLISLLSEEQRIELMLVCGQIARPDKYVRKQINKAIRKIEKDKGKIEDRHKRAETGIRKARTVSVFTAPKSIESDATIESSTLNSYRNCYICNAEYKTLHHFYDALCPNCGDLNYSKRFQTCNLTNQIALITGSRVKIGYQATLIMLRAGAHVIATTRFPVDSAIRFASEPDYSDWKDRLDIYGLDLRHLPSVELFAKYIENKYPRLDLLLNNAAQTVRRPSGFYAHLMEKELGDIQSQSVEVIHLLRNYELLKLHLSGDQGWLNKDFGSLPVKWNSVETGIGITNSAALSQRPYTFDIETNTQDYFPEGQLDADLQQVDLRTTNSWRLYLGDIESTEMIEVHLVNLMAPFILNNRLVHLMKKQNTGCKHIINVTAMEGKFYRFSKSARHPHTNMAKAALNMLTHTAASELAKFGIFMNAVDTGWVTDEDPYFLAMQKEKIHDFQPPLDIVDGAARICDPFIDGINSGIHWSGKFLKDYFPIDW